MAQRGPDSCKEFIDPKWLGHVVVCAQVQCGDLLLFLLSGREHNDWRWCPLAHLANHVNAIQVRESEIKQDEIGIPRFDFDQTSLSCCGFVDSETMAGECCPKKAPDFRFILDENDRRFL